MRIPVPRQSALLLGLVLIALTAAGCGSSGAGSSSNGFSVVATTTQLGDFARAVGGSHVDVHQILQPNTDPHDYEPRPGDVRAVAGAKLVIESGSRLDQWMGKVVPEAGGSPTVLTVAPGHTPYRQAGETSGPEASHFDPHWWHDPRNAKVAIAAIGKALGDADPKHKQGYAERGALYAARLRRLDTGIAACFAAVPRAERKLVTDHDAFDYFAKRYGIDVIGAVVPSQSTQAQSSAKSVAALSGLIRKEHVKAVFPESSINPKLAQAIARQTGARSNLVLYGDTLGPRGSRGASYVSMEVANADAMVRGFTGGARGCRVPGAG